MCEGKGEWGKQRTRVGSGDNRERGSGRFCDGLLESESKLVDVRVKLRALRRGE